MSAEKIVDDLLQSLCRSDTPLLHCDNREDCGICTQRKIGAEVGKELLEEHRQKPLDAVDAARRWSDECQRRFEQTKFWKLWQECKAQGLKPEEEFAKRGWTP
jgi:hypothetical protein